MGYRCGSTGLDSNRQEIPSGGSKRKPTVYPPSIRASVVPPSKLQISPGSTVIRQGQGGVGAAVISRAPNCPSPSCGMTINQGYHGVAGIALQGGRIQRGVSSCSAAAARPG